PWISGEFGLVDDQGSGGSLTGSLFELIGPAAVIGHGFAAEHLRIVDLRIIDEDHNDLALHTVLKIVPVELRSHDAITGENQVRVDGYRILLLLGPSHKVVGEFQRPGMV